MIKTNSKHDRKKPAHIRRGAFNSARQKQQDYSRKQNYRRLCKCRMLDQVVVTSSKTETRRRESPSLVNVLSGKTFLDVGACWYRWQPQSTQLPHKKHHPHQCAYISHTYRLVPKPAEYCPSLLGKCFSRNGLRLLLPGLGSASLRLGRQPPIGRLLLHK